MILGKGHFMFVYKRPLPNVSERETHTPWSR